MSGFFNGSFIFVWELEIRQCWIFPRIRTLFCGHRLWQVFSINHAWPEHWGIHLFMLSWIHSMDAASACRAGDGWGVESDLAPPGLEARGKWVVARRDQEGTGLRGHGWGMWGQQAGLARWERMLLERTAAEPGHGCPVFSPVPWSAPMSTSCRSWARCGLSTGPRWSSCTGATRSSRRPWPCSQSAAPASVAAPKPDLPSCVACTCVFFSWCICWWELFLLFAVVLWVLKYIQGPQLSLLKYSKKTGLIQALHMFWDKTHWHILRQTDY